MESFESCAAAATEQGRGDELKRGPSLSSCSDTETYPLNKTANTEKVHQTPVLQTCKLCLEDFALPSDAFTITSCNCSFCKQCMQCYVEVLIRDGVVLSITCPDSDCWKSGIITADEIKLLVQPETFVKYQKLKFEQEVAIDPHRTFCPEESCSTVCHVCSTSSNSTPALEPFPVSCPTCHLQFCYICKAGWRTSHRCNSFAVSIGNEFQRLQNMAGLSMGDNVTIKRCPVCNILIEKDRGCAQMICKNCSHVFCWYCLKLLDNDFLLRHYDKGPCRNMLGHSRAQVVRHRIGVVGLFAAFSLLFIVASPVLLLAAPIVLCCKCKECCQQAINRANQHRGSMDVTNRNKSSVALEDVQVRRDQASTSNSVKSDVNSPDNGEVLV